MKLISKKSQFTNFIGLKTHTLQLCINSDEILQCLATV